ncbi:hypothetical protein OG756_06185 [Streptomyces sp. NBC_01310]|uniref:ATP-binding protein n=1 Tax=unclassified Streptomyces TaxID=2593676 RepID=UPI0035B69ED0|nr:hypothetical protein OG756_06185 [Streptomyces sp. NBC_01310]
MADLVEQARSSGQPVEFTERGERRPRPVEAELAAYRVVQEALTNAMKHAAGQRTHVVLGHGEERIEIEVTTDGPVGSTVAGPAARAPRPAGGRGLAGLRERLRMLDGELVAGPLPDCRFGVRPCDLRASAALSRRSGGGRPRCRRGSGGSSRTVRRS